MAAHKDTTSTHNLIRGTFANSTARTSYSATVFDVGCLFHQTDNNSFWILLDDSPLTWLQLNPAGSLQVKEVDGAPDVSGVSIIRVSNGTLTSDGAGQVTITTGGGAGGGSGTPEEVAIAYAIGLGG
jgi:hypothetical protein